ncbi:MAG: thioesterase family protein [Solirubrobacterales bacterium]
MAPTLELTIHFRAKPRPGEQYALTRFWTEASIDGLFDEMGEVWDANGRLLAQSRQIALLRRGAARAERRQGSRRAEEFGFSRPRITRDTVLAPAGPHQLKHRLAPRTRPRGRLSTTPLRRTESSDDVHQLSQGAKSPSAASTSRRP